MLHVAGRASTAIEMYRHHKMHLHAIYTQCRRTYLSLTGQAVL